MTPGCNTTPSAAASTTASLSARSAIVDAKSQGDGESFEDYSFNAAVCATAAICVSSAAILIGGCVADGMSAQAIFYYFAGPPQVNIAPWIHPYLSSLAPCSVMLVSMEQDLPSKMLEPRQLEQGSCVQLATLEEVQRTEHRFSHDESLADFL